MVGSETLQHSGRLTQHASYRGILVTIGGQAASGCWLTASMPSTNFIPLISFGN